jgi:uridine kinase
VGSKAEKGTESGVEPVEEMTLGAVARLVSELAPSCGPVRLVAVDGHAGSGKTTLAGRLAALLGGAPVVHMDDLATHEEPFAWTGRLTEQVLGALSGGRAAVHEVYDWNARRFAGTREIPAAPVVLLEGVGAGRAALRPYLALVLWLEVGPDQARRRGLLRDGPELAHFWTGWNREEDAHFAADPTRPYADLLIHQARGGPPGEALGAEGDADGEGDEGDGYTAVPGPAASRRHDTP